MKSTKRALVLSTLSILMCLAMLIGTTYAWFTDTASTAVNTIQSGTLDVDLVDAQGNSLVGTGLTFQKAADAPADEAVLWEPGCTYNLQEVYVKNNGNLALRYKLAITGVDGDAKLLEAIEWTVTNGTAAVDLDTFEGYLKPGETSAAPIVLTGHMLEGAGNEYQNLTADGVGITVYAAQWTYEYDSIDNQYDANAPYDPIAVVASIETPADIVIMNAGSFSGEPEKCDLDVAYTFVATDDAETIVDNFYKYWHADFVVTADAPIAAGKAGLAGQYESWSTDWLAFYIPVDAEAGQSYRLLGEAGALIAGSSITMTYEEICTIVETFNCGAWANPNYASDLEGITLTVELRLYETTEKSPSMDVETGNYLTIGTYDYTF